MSSSAPADSPLTAHSYEIRTYAFSQDGHRALHLDTTMHDWPVVYVLHRPAKSPKGQGEVYIGESLNMDKRFGDHLKNEAKARLEVAEVIVDDTFNKSSSLDLESFLINLSSGDESNRTLNSNAGQQEKNYYNRSYYQLRFREIFDDLRAKGIFSKSIQQIENSEMFKYSPFKSLNEDQMSVVSDILDGLVEDFASPPGENQVAVVQGDPGTGKTIVATFLMKLLADLGSFVDDADEKRESIFEDFYLDDVRALFRNRRIGLVVPMQDLRKTLTRVFASTPGLSAEMVRSPREVALDDERYDLLVVDEAHRLSQFGAQSIGALTKEFREINERLFHGERPAASQLDWLRERSDNTILLVDTSQTVKPIDLSTSVLRALIEARDAGHRREYVLHSQMRSIGGNDYIDYVKQVLSPYPPKARSDFGPYEIGLVDDPRTLVDLIRTKNGAHGLSRVVAGYAWDWVSKKDPERFDIHLDHGVQLRWNSTVTDWINSSKSSDEAGSIHTVQGHDLNYAGVIFGQDLQYDLENERLIVSREDYRDKTGKRNNKLTGRDTTDEMLLEFITNIYYVLMTRGVHGTFIHVVDPGLREYLGRYFPVLTPRTDSRNWTLC
ncbi:DNA/RNA helicase domain-containing protein [Corynebacterium sp.]|uniref:DNA/RNA helicase domain-containing protein n=1 Tax=Corynebacterium sp. TaxID=1720 RepID=UPI0028AC4A3D|nr:DNA/RNA helicase domain-containing protein [Corynebacterium sp.]